MRYLPTLLILTASPAFAHPGHLADLAGHGHWIGAAAAGAAIAIAIWAGLKGKAKPEADREPNEETPQEA